ncbi:TlpA disulfide reductase family protein [soil metagenome]
MRVAIFCILTSAFCFAAACRPAAAPVTVSTTPVSVNGRPTTNQPMPPTKPVTEMTWTTADDKVQKVSDMAGKVVILDFWATYCPPCKAEIPHLNSLIAKYGADNIQIVGLNVGGDEDRVEIPAFVKSTKFDYPIAYPEDELSRFIFAERDDIPQTVVFDRTGRMLTKIVGFGDGPKSELNAAVEKAINSQ